MKRMLLPKNYERICGVIPGEDLPHFGLPDTTTNGIVDRENIAQLKHLLEQFPHLHAISHYRMRERPLSVNYFDENALYFQLCDGDADPNIEIDFRFETMLARMTPEERQRSGENLMKILFCVRRARDGES